jgi:hypothetical protein
MQQFKSNFKNGLPVTPETHGVLQFLTACSSGQVAWSKVILLK